MVLFVSVDNSNVWIEGQRLSAVRFGLAVNPVEAMKRGIVDHDWRYDFGRLYAIACPESAPVGRSICSVLDRLPTTRCGSGLSGRDSRCECSTATPRTRRSR